MKRKEKQADATTPPTANQRAEAKSSIVKAVNGWLEARIDEVFDMADEGVEPIRWDDLKEVREQICSCLADDLNHGLGEVVQEILEVKLIGDGATAPTGERINAGCAG